MAVVNIGLLTAGCLGGPRPEPSPLKTEVIGAVLPPMVDGGPPIECRGLEHERCTSAGSFEGDLGGIARTAIARVIVSCTGATCTARGGAMRLDLLLQDGSTVEVARGGYGEFRQP
jgi:hypothetical protein